VGPDGAPWFTGGGQNAIVRVDPATKAVKEWSLPPERMPTVHLNTTALRQRTDLIHAQIGVYGWLRPKSGEMKVSDAPKGWGPYGITATPKGDIWFVWLAGSYLANVDTETGLVTAAHEGSGPRRVWSDSRGGSNGIQGTSAYLIHQ
jgi:virginiamycin B lyase